MGKKGSGGSQLAQLKAKIRGAGVTDRRQMKGSAKKRKRDQASAEKEEQQARREKLSRIASSSTFNPFEERVTKPKNEVLGRKIRGATGRPGQAKQGGLRERTEKLLPEWINRNKSGSFVDRRFGERGDESISLEDKMLERFTRERQKKANKASMFNLEDAEEEGLTHYGRSLNDMDQYDDIRLSDEEGPEDQAGPRFGGFDDEEEEPNEDRQRSKAEVMKEVMAKSKLAKQERQQARVADDDLRKELDDGIGDLRSLLMSSMDTDSKKNEEESSNEKRPLFGAQESKPDAYDSNVRELAFERRAKPQDRLKTEEEKAQELADKLRKAESDRLRRMRGEEIDEDEDGGSKGGQRKRQAGGDDLEDDFVLDGVSSNDVYGLGHGLQKEAAEESDQSEDDESDQGDENELHTKDPVQQGHDEDEEGGKNSVDEEETEDSDDEEDDFEDLADREALAIQGEDDEDEEVSSDLEDIVKSRVSKGSATKRTEALPFTFPSPTTLEDFLETIKSHDVAVADVPIVVKRIRALNHASFGPESRMKLVALLGVLIDYILHLCSTTVDAASTRAHIKTINDLVPQIFALTKVHPQASAERFVQKLALMQRNLARGLARGATDLTSKTWPGLAECVLLKVTGAVWPTSDRAHPVSTPLALLIAQYLSSCRIRSLNDLACGLYLASLVVEQQGQSKRIVPEAVNFLHNAAILLAPLKSDKMLKELNNEFGIPCPDLELPSSESLRLYQEFGADMPVTKTLSLAELLKPHQVNEDVEGTKYNELLAAFSLISDFARLYLGSVAFVELFKPFEKLLADVIGPLPPSLEEGKQTTLELLTRTVRNAQRQRLFLRLQAHRAIPIASHVPKFDQGFDPERRGGRTFDPDAQRAEVSKLRALAKKERKGAMRELRRDNEFLAEARRNAREEEDQRYAKSIGKIMGSLAAERSEEKSSLREKQKLKRRAGKK